MTRWRDVLRSEKMGPREHVITLPGGETVERQGRSLIVSFPDEKRVVLSSATLNGGLLEGPKAICNTTGIFVRADDPIIITDPDEYREYDEECVTLVGLDPKRTVALGTGITMDKAVIVTRTIGRTAVSAVVTAGVEGNGGRAGDPATYDQLVEYKVKEGTIVIILLIEASLPAHSLARAVITATEAKTCALQQLMASSVYSNGIATGTGTDQIAVVCNKGSNIKLTDAGNHSVLGELIGKCVTEAVLKALDSWGGLNAVSQRDAMKRLARYGVKDDDYFASSDGREREDLMEDLRRTAENGEVVAAVSSAVHLQDEIEWGLLTEEDGNCVAGRILYGLMDKMGVKGPEIEMNGGIISNTMKALMQIALAQKQDRTS